VAIIKTQKSTHETRKFQEKKMKMRAPPIFGLERH